MIKDKKQFLIYFGISFGATLIVAFLISLLVFKGVFFNTHKSRGDAFMRSGKYAQAIEQYESALKKNSKNQEIYLALADAYAKNENFDSAGKIIDQAINKKITTDKNGVEELYLMRVKIFSSAGDLAGAVNYISSINDQYMLKKIESKRPDDLTYTPTQGKYEQTVKMKITVREGETVYYTTDGSYPTKYSNIYSAPINISNGNTKVCAISVDEAGLVSPMLSVTYKVSNDNEDVVFDDAKIEKMVRAALSKPSGKIKVKELESVTELSNEGVDGQIKTLSDLERMPALESLYIENEKNIASIAHFASLTNLKSLTLSGCGLTNDDLNALGSLTALEDIDISNNNLTSANVLSNLTTLKHISIAKNNIIDISYMTTGAGVEYVDASGNRLTSIPEFENTDSIKTLVLSKNKITDLSTIHRYSALAILELSSNAITNAKNIGKLSSLEALDLSGNPTTNFDFLSSLSSLVSLNVSNTSFLSAKPVSKLPLINLNASKTGLSSVSEIASISTLTSLNISDTEVTDVAPLSKLAALDYLDISNCKIADVSALKNIKSLYTLKAQNVNLSSVNFENKELMIVQ